ncbi:hypothetical protein HZA97_08950 [Candidatus Woesearchaeota archaeon]|nr:hypothetical protein [Candidatus Woesearchaeota archaeon]
MQKKVNIGKIALITGGVMSVLLLLFAIYLLVFSDSSSVSLGSFVPSILKGKGWPDYVKELQNLTFTAEYQVNGTGVNLDLLKISQNSSKKVRIDGEIKGVKGYFLKLDQDSFFCTEKCKKIDELNYLIPLNLASDETVKEVKSREGDDCFALQNNTICFNEQSVISYFSANNKELILTNVNYSITGGVFEVK